MHSPRVLKKGEIYHICNKSIAGSRILKSHNSATRYLQAIDYYNTTYPARNFAKFLLRQKERLENQKFHLLAPKRDRIVKIMAFCIMPDHYHLLVRILKEGILSHYVNTIQNSYTRYFNIKFKRKGPLWQSRFRYAHIKTNEQLLHVSRYIHLNPTTASLVKNPKDWEYSSYREYIEDSKVLNLYNREISIRSRSTYKKFVEDNKDYQKKLGKIKRLMLD